MPTYRPKHNRALFLRRMTERAVHGLALKLMRLYHQGEASDRQEWLLDQTMAELLWRQDRKLPQDRCTCQLCFEVLGEDLGGSLSSWSPWGEPSGSETDETELDATDAAGGAESPPWTPPTQP